MNTFDVIAETKIPALTAWCLNDLGDARDNHERLVKQSQAHPRDLRKSALIESTISPTELRE